MELSPQEVLAIANCGLPMWDRWLGHNSPESPAAGMEMAGVDSFGPGGVA